MTNEKPDVFRYFFEPSNVSEKCIFCKIASGRIKPGSRSNPKELIYNDDNYVAFDDIHPGASSHTLVIPKAHIKNCWSITPQMMDDMERIGKLILQERNPEKKPSVMFFIRPPFNSIFHVHLHVMVLPLTDSMFHLRRIGFQYHLFHVTPTELREYFKKEKRENI